MRPGRFVPACLILLLSILMFSHFPLLPLPAKVAADTLSSVYVTPVQNCCILATASSPVYTVDVMMNLSSTDLINGFDVRLNYTNFFAPGPPKHGVVKAVSLDYSTNYFATNFGSGQVTTQASCIDEITYGPSGFCASDDVTGGQVHVAQTLLGTNMTGPVNNALLFSVTFTVNDTGTSLMYIERAHLADPGGVPPNPHFVPVTTAAAVFGNDQLVAFFDYRSTSSPSVLAGVSARFDASSSFRSGSSKMSLIGPTFAWDFGDGNKTTSTNPILSHTFQRAGNYTVSLNVTDALPNSGSFQRIVQVTPQLGTLHVQVKNLYGGSIIEIVTVKLYNLTNPVPPLCNGCTKTITAGGFVDFVGLTPGSYSMNFTGAGVVPSGKVTIVGVGWPNMETVYLQEIQIPGPNYFPLLIFSLVIGVGLGLGALALYMRSRSTRRLANSGGLARKARKPAPR
jgi:PKD repeat protein